MDTDNTFHNTSKHTIGQEPAFSYYIQRLISIPLTQKMKSGKIYFMWLRIMDFLQNKT